MMSRSRSSFASRHSQEDQAEITRLNLRNIVQGSVERTIAWLNRCRRLAKDWECLSRKALAFLHLASIRLISEGSLTQQNDPGQTLRVQPIPVPRIVLDHSVDWRWLSAGLGRKGFDLRSA